MGHIEYLNLQSQKYKKFVVSNYYHPNEAADLAAAISRASLGDADPLKTCCIA